uniref:3-hydroxyisobutyrate dehydrogenase n=1 Tax=Stygiella incarcerata TaxID=1712417 RepID=A0A192ZIQ9_9EUKA|nr:3-hydroxyisobutyrate dehydrogenase [Stygiella incarcerata]|eukprot:TRINITY_DN7537_c0_g1_i1.p1 TRINITY_DN7537_c0_g1~~TRINITY_DN7537_c0_g1_i1.p1  ORF type:complete len:296 (-),score=80.02 TRINITY_DN7537_c0_g1_i1:181-1068(-)
MSTFRVGWIGCGVMGLQMAGHVLRSGFPLSVYSKTRSKCEPLLSQGAQWEDSPVQVARTCDIICMIVGYPSDVESVVLDPESGVIAGLRPNAVVVDLTTSTPALAKKIYEEVSSRGGQALDAPVSGGDIGARNGTLSIMIGGHEEAYERAIPVLKCFGKNIRLMGPPGSGQHTKMSNQIVIASGMVGVVEGLLYAERAGLEPSEVIAVIEKGAAASFSLSSYGPRILRGDYEPGFFVDHFIKDMGIALKEAEHMGLKLPGLSLAYDLYNQLKEMGFGKKGTQALMLALKKMNQRE